MSELCTHYANTNTAVSDITQTSMSQKANVKQHFRALAGLAKAATNLYNRVSRFSHDIPCANVRKDLINLLYKYRRVSLSLSTQLEEGDN